MALGNTFNNFSNGKSWQDKVLDADAIWAQVNAALSANGLKLPPTARRPDVRMIISNVSGAPVQFLNPGDHSGSKQEVIPATGDKTAAMVMVKGATLDEQYKNAEALYKKYDLGTQGLSTEFVADLMQGKLADFIAEAYGPAPFQSQAEKLVNVTWAAADGTSSEIIPEHGFAAAYGARAATTETVFLAKFHIYVKGSTTTAELVESDGMNIAVSSDWQTKVETTRPIVPSVAKTYYGAHFGAIPAVIVHPDGMIKEIDLKNGTVIRLDDNATSQKPQSLKNTSATPKKP